MDSGLLSAAAVAASLVLTAWMRRHRIKSPPSLPAPPPTTPLTTSDFTPGDPPMSTSRVTGAMLLDLPSGVDAAGHPLTTRVTGAVLLDVPNDQIAALTAAVAALGAKLDALTTAVTTAGSGSLVS